MIDTMIKTPYASLEENEAAWDKIMERLDEKRNATGAQKEAFAKEDEEEKAKEVKVEEQGEWSPEETAKLITAIQQFPAGNDQRWMYIQEAIASRTLKSVIYQSLEVVKQVEDIKKAKALAEKNAAKAIE